MSRRRARCSSSSASSSSRWFSARNGWWVVHSPYDEGVPDEQLAADLAVDPAELHQPVGGQRYAVQGDPLVGHHRGPLLGPVRLAVGALREVVAEALGPLGPDRGVLPGPEAAGLDQLAGHDVRRVLPPQPAPGEDREPRAAGAEVLAGAARATPAVAARGTAVALLQQADVGEQSGQQCLVDAVGVGDVAAPGVELVGAPRSIFSSRDTWRSWDSKSCHSRTRR